MGEPGDYHTKWYKLDRERQISYDIITYAESKKNDTNELTYLQNRDRLGEGTYGY